MGLLDRLDRRNQRVSDFLHEHPEAGKEAFPYAKGAKERQALGLLAVGPLVVALLLRGLVGTWWIAAIPVAVGLVATFILRSRLEHRPAKKL